MTFHFVDNWSIDKTSRKRIRSHVMTGKNAGRTLNRASKYSRIKNTATKDENALPKKVEQMLETVTRDEVVPKKTEETSVKRDQPAIVSVICKALGHQYTGYSVPVEFSIDGRKTVHQFFTIITDTIYPHEFCNPFPPEKTHWICMTFIWDEAYYHCTLSLLAACVDFYLEQKKPSVAALTHLSQAMQMINKRISNGEGLSDLTVFNVLSLTIYEQLREEPKRSKLHLDGLYRIIQLRGGLIQFAERREMVLKICRVDIDLALSSGSSTTFRLEDIAEVTRNSLHGVKPTICPLINISDGLVCTCAALQDLIMDTLAMAQALNNSEARKLDHIDFQATLVSLSYRLIDISPLKPSSMITGSDKATHLGLMAFLITLQFQFGRRRLLCHELLATQLKAFLQATSIKVRNGSFTMLWLLFIGRISVFEEKEESWILPLMKQELNKTDIEDILNLSERLQRFPWINKLYDEPSRQLYNRALKSSTNASFKDKN